MFSLECSSIKFLISNFKVQKVHKGGGESPMPQWFPCLPLHVIHIFSLQEIFRTRSSGSVSFECSHVEFALAGKATTEGDVLLKNNSANYTFKHNSNHTSEGAILLQKKKIVNQSYFINLSKSKVNVVNQKLFSLKVSCCCPIIHSITWGCHQNDNITRHISFTLQTKYKANSRQLVTVKRQLK